MLLDDDRIFTNIYGWQDFGLKAAKLRGDWNKTIDLLNLGHDYVINQIKSSFDRQCV